MAIDARLIQAGIQQGIQANQPVTNLLSGVNAGQNFMQNRQNLQRGNIQNQMLQDQAPLQQQQLEQGVSLNNQKLAIQQDIVDTLGVPDIATAKEVAFNFSKLSGLSDTEIPGAIERIIANGQNNGRTTDNIEEVRSVFARDPVAGRELINNVINSFERTGVLEAPGGSGGLASAKTEIFDNGTMATLLPDKTTQVTNPRGDIVTGEERVKVLKTAREEQIAFAGKKAASTERGKLSEQKRLLPDIRAAIKTAEIEASGQGTLVSEINTQKSAIPGLTKVVSRLKSLADDATFTMTGKVFNAIAKEFGLSTDGDTARSSMVSIVDNQVLPLLRPVFGSQFTEVEGERLRNAFLDPDSTPDSRRASLDSFLEQMKRNISTKEEELRLGGGDQTGNNTPTTSTRIKFDSQGNIIQ